MWKRITAIFQVCSNIDNLKYFSIIVNLRGEVGTSQTNVIIALQVLHGCGREHAGYHAVTP